MKNEILHLYRMHRLWETDFVASKLSILHEEYLDLEEGKHNVDSEIAQRLSKLYNAPLFIFLHNKLINQQIIVYTNCVFNDSNGYVHNLH